MTDLCSNSNGMMFGVVKGYARTVSVGLLVDGFASCYATVQEKNSISY